MIIIEYEDIMTLCVSLKEKNIWNIYSDHCITYDDINKVYGLTITKSIKKSSNVIMTYSGLIHGFKICDNFIPPDLISDPKEALIEIKESFQKSINKSYYGGEWNVDYILIYNDKLIYYNSFTKVISEIIINNNYFAIGSGASNFYKIIEKDNFIVNSETIKDIFKKVSLENETVKCRNDIPDHIFTENLL